MPQHLSDKHCPKLVQKSPEHSPADSQIRRALVANNSVALSDFLRWGDLDEDSAKEGFGPCLWNVEAKRAFKREPKSVSLAFDCSCVHMKPL